MQCSKHKFYFLSTLREKLIYFVFSNKSACLCRCSVVPPQCVEGEIWTKQQKEHPETSVGAGCWSCWENSLCSAFGSDCITFGGDRHIWSKPLSSCPIIQQPEDVSLKKRKEKKIYLHSVIERNPVAVLKHTSEVIVKACRRHTVRVIMWFRRLIVQHLARVCLLA